MPPQIEVLKATVMSQAANIVMALVAIWEDSRIVEIKIILAK